MGEGGRGWERVGEGGRGWEKVGDLARCEGESRLEERGEAEGGFGQPVKPTERHFQAQAASPSRGVRGAPMRCAYVAPTSSSSSR